MVAALLSFSAVSYSATEENPTLPTTKRELEYVGVRSLEASNRIAIPTLYVKFMNWGRMTPLPYPDSSASGAAKRERSSRPTLEMTVPINTKLVHTIARELYDDLVAQLRAAGWQVVTNRDLSNSTALFRLPQEETEPEFGVPVDTTNPYKEKRRYLKVAPDGMPVIKFSDGLATLHGVAKEQQADIVIVTYIFDPVAFEAAPQQASAGNSAPLGQRASLQLAYASLDFLNPKRELGAIRSRGPAQLWANIGSLTPSGENAADIESNKRRGLYVLRLDPDALQKCAIDSGKEFNREAVEGMMKALKK